MLKSVAQYLHPLTRPVFAVIAAGTIFIAAAAILAQHIVVTNTPAHDVEVEKVAIAQKIEARVPNPALKVNVSQESHAAAQRAGGSEPQIERAATVSLYVTNVDVALAGLSRLAQRERGDVFQLQAQSAVGAAKAAGASIDIRVPSSRFYDAMNAVTQVGKVRDRQVNAQDLSSDITDSSARLINLRRTEADMRKIMDRSGSVEQILDVENQLSQVREQIETLEADIASMNRRVTYATISVDLAEETSNVAVEPTVAAQLASTWRQAMHALSQMIVALLSTLLWLVVFSPFAIAIAVALGATIAVVRRRTVTQVSSS